MASKLSNYTVSKETATLFVDQAVLTVTPAAKSKTYGQLFSAFTGSITGEQNGDEFSATYDSAGAPAAADAGEYPITVTSVAGESVASKLSNYTVSKETATLFVDQAVLTVTPAAKSKTYGQLFSAFTGSITGEQNGDEFSATYDSAGAPAAADAGEYPITVTSVAGESVASKLSNYTVSKETATLFVDQAVLTVTPAAKSKTYGQLFSAFTGSITGEQNGDEFSATYDSAGAPAAADAGEYPITVTSVAGESVASKLSNYTVSKETATLFVDQAVLTVTPAAKSKTYGQLFSAFTGSITGEQNGDEFSATYDSAGAPAAADAGEYPITVTSVAGESVASKLSNYTVSKETATLFVDQAVLTVTPAAKSKTYGQLFSAFTGSITGEQNGDEFSATYDSAGAPAAADAGEYPITVTPVAGESVASKLSNNTVSKETATLFVDKAVIAVNAEPKSKILNAGDPTFTWNLTGFKNGQNPGTAGVTGSAGCVRVPGEGVGTYTITCLPGTLTAANYSFAQGATALLSIGYRWDGFRQPINDTAHQTGVLMSKFKLGLTVPAKFQLKDVNGVVVQQAAAPQFRAARLGTCEDAAALETVGTVSPDNGATYSWDGTQYHYNWSTKGLTAGLYRVRAVLADGNTAAYVDICLSK